MTKYYSFTVCKTQKWLLRIVTVMFILLFLNACAVSRELQGSEKLTSCHVIFDAGSSATRLYIYQQSDAGWIRHDGPKTAALADPVRGNRGKTMADAEAVTSEIVMALDQLIDDGPPNKSGENKWTAFDWRSQCRVDSAAVYATAGMRLAEQQHPANTQALWKMLNLRLGDMLGMEVVTRTLTGFEEGLYAWLAAREGPREAASDGQFGTAEMGGASAQVTFPCERCEASRRVVVHSEEIMIFSDSYLGLGQDEARKKHLNWPACKWGAGLKDTAWRVSDCTNGMVFSEEFEADSVFISSQLDINRWYLSGAFRYTRYSDVENYCRNKIDSGYKPKTACFRALYQEYFLNSLGVPVSSELSDTDWTLGAVICGSNSCLSKAGPPECEWSAHGCQQP